MEKAKILLPSYLKQTHKDCIKKTLKKLGCITVGKSDESITVEIPADVVDVIKDMSSCDYMLVNFYN